MSGDSRVVLKKRRIEEDNNEGSDDLEKALVLAAADADARSKNDSEITTPDPPDKPDDCAVPAPKQDVIASAPQSSTSYAKIVASHYNSIEEKGLDERSKSRIFYMRNFHNWIKSMLINEYMGRIRNSKKHNSPIRVADMCCGKGGDLMKWKKAGITHLICSDIAEISMSDCKTRYTDLVQRTKRERGQSNLFSIEFIVADCTRVRLREKHKDPSMKLDLVSCQFAAHYSFESLPQAECLIHNAAECLQPGGFFIGTIPDANDLVARLRKSDTNSFGNDVFNVNFDCDVNKPPLFGAKYNFQLDGVVNCPEFLVHFGTFTKLCKKYGLKLVRCEKFYEFYERIRSEGVSLMRNMKGLECYPPYPGSFLVGGAVDDYKHAKDFLGDSSNRDVQKIGTLSKSEWEASSLYLTFAFEKVKNTWTADGKPLYDI